MRLTVLEQDVYSVPGEPTRIERVPGNQESITPFTLVPMRQATNCGKTSCSNDLIAYISLNARPDSYLAIVLMPSDFVEHSPLRLMCSAG